MKQLSLVDWNRLRLRKIDIGLQHFGRSAFMRMNRVVTAAYRQMYMQPVDSFVQLSAYARERRQPFKVSDSLSLNAN